MRGDFPLSQECFIKILAHSTKVAKCVFVILNSKKSIIISKLIDARNKMADNIINALYHEIKIRCDISVCW